MEFLFYSIVFILGLAVGSFLNCVIYRLEKNKSFLKGRSFCPYCKHVLKLQDLIPVFSFLILKGKCRYCRKKISWQYPLVEIATGLLFVFILNYELGIMNYEILDFGFILNFLFLILTFSFLILIFVYDLKHYIIPDKVVYPAIIISFVYLIAVYDMRLMMYAFLSAVFASGFFLFIVLISQGRWMGLGDVKLAFFMGLFLGFPNILVALFFAFLIGAIIGIGLILKGKKSLKSEVPFGPFLIIGTFIAFFWGEIIINWYFNLI